MTDPKLREARIAEAKRRCDQSFLTGVARPDCYSHHLLDLIQADWRPEPKVDEVTLAFRKWGKKRWGPEFEDAKHDHGTVADAFRAGHAHALANCADVRRMDWLEGQKLSIEATRVKDDLHHYPNATPTLRTKIDRAMEGGE